ncbi:trigger factor [Weeksellaceae bacterium TAE3-ERU29]|nr:trigger factor [Weeksellaceae bacterium TAE3-ERU29]
MNVTHVNADDLSAVLTVSIDKADYTDKVNSALKNYKKNANVPGFRKGHVPMGLIKKQYEKPLIYEEVNKLLQENVDKYLTENKIEILGQPLPKEDKSFDWDNDTLKFEFELGLAPQFDVNLEEITLPYHKIQVSDEDVDKYIENFRMRYGKMSEAETAAEGAYLKGIFYELDENGEETAEHYHATIAFNDLKSKELFEGKKKDDKVEVDAKEVFEDDDKLAATFGLEKEEVADFNKKLVFKIQSITNHEKAEMNQEFFDKIYGEGEVDSEEAFRAKVKEESEKMYVEEADRVMLTNGLLYLVENTKFDLPKDFLVKWVQFSNKEADSPEKAEEMYEGAEKGMRFQLVEGKVANKFDISVTKEDIESQAIEMVKKQIAMYGAGMNFDDAMLKNIAQQALQDENQYRQLADQVFAGKMLQVFKDNVKLEEKEVSFDEFLEDVKAQNERTK